MDRFGSGRPLAWRRCWVLVAALPTALVLAVPPVSAQAPEVSLPQAATSAAPAMHHGADVPPPGMSVDDDVEPEALRSGDSPDIACAGDGESGPRVEVLYARASNVPDRYSSYLASFRTWVGDADSYFSASAAETGGSRRLRFVHNASCALVVHNVVLSPTGDDSFDNTVTELQAAGYTRDDRRYMTFVDANILCGLSGFWADDQPSLENANNHGTLYGRLDAGCWSGHAFAHELTHMLGGVQLSAPNSSGGSHCTDENDIMCYPDAPNYPTMQTECANAANEYRLDCNHDDYFSTAPAAGSYLATHWNVANSAFLMAGSPALTALAPTSGPLAGGTVVTVTGVNFTGATKVTFNGAAGTSLKVVSPTTLKVTAPARSAAGVVNVQVTTSGGTSPANSAAKYSYAGAPSVSSMRPTSGRLAGGTVVTITGVNFTGATRVTFNGVAGTALTVVSATTLKVTTPARTTAGAVNVQVTAPGGRSATGNTAKYTYKA